MLGSRVDVSGAAVAEAAVASIEATLETLDADAAVLEGAAVEGEVVVVPLEEGDAAVAVGEVAIFEVCFGDGLVANFGRE